MAYYTREQWGSRFDRGGYQIGMVSEFYVHHFGGGMRPTTSVEESMARMRSVQRTHAETNGWSDIGYSFVVDNLGNVFEGRGWGRSGAHTYGYNSKGHAAAWMGDSTVEGPSGAALAAIATVYGEGVALGHQAPGSLILAHRDRVPDTACCGDPMYGQLDRIRLMANTPGSALEIHTPTNPTAIPNWNEDHDMHLCLYRPTGPSGPSLYLLVRGDGTYRIMNADTDMSWPVINSKMVQLAQAGLVPRHPDGAPVIGEIFDDGLAELQERP